MNSYNIRWYSGVKKLGEASVHKDSNLIWFNYPNTGEPRSGMTHIPREEYRVIEAAAQVNPVEDN